ncbi:hypothetical protein P3674_22170 [Vibrio parahaemolyticus]|nr:hypothetical protein [Vibrio parahaemolyticus]MDF5387699.1 hypothetical protein [Vibrio parahaemolyticus]MDF5451468.1 hypothetical protein [Vibrio parahaemolyticus]
MKSLQIYTLNKYSDWLKKAHYNFEQYRNTGGVFELADCLLTLNALPEWIIKADTAPDSLREECKEIIDVMKGKSLDIDPRKLNSSASDKVYHQLRLIRMFCNHAKHGDPKSSYGQIVIEVIDMSAKFPLKFPVRFEELKAGNEQVNAPDLISDILEFWGQRVDFA